MVPPLERNEYLMELRFHADSMVRERFDNSELHPVAHSSDKPPQRAHVTESFPEGSGNLGTPVGPAFDIPMTQDKTLEELPSQIDFEWQESDSPRLAPALPTSTTVAPTDIGDNAFAEISEIAEEAVVRATQHIAEQDTDIRPAPSVGHVTSATHV